MPSDIQRFGRDTARVDAVMLLGVLRLTSMLNLAFLLLIFTTQLMGRALHGSIILYSRAGCLYELDIGHSLELHASICGLYPAWSPDGSRLAYIAGGRAETLELYVATLPLHSASPTLQITHDQMSNYAPTWSPDGTRLAFWEYQPDNNRWDVLMVDVVSGDGRVTRVAGTFEVGYPTLAWSPDGRWLAFGAGRFSTGIELYLMEVSSGLVRRLTDNVYRDDSPAWSPDSRRLVFTSAADSFNRLYIIDIESGVRHLLTAAVSGYMPAWSPDGTQIVFGSNHADGYNDLYLINVDGSGLRQLTTRSQETGVDENEPEWMP